MSQLVNKLHVLFVTYDGLTDPLGQSQILPYLIQLNRRGYRISILSNEKPKGLAQNYSAVKAILEKEKISWRFVQYQNQPPIIGTLLNIRRMKKALEKWHQEQAFQAFHCRSIIPAIIADKCRDQQKEKLIFDIRGFWADERVEGGLWKLSNPVYAWMYRYFKGQEKKLFAKADHIVSLTENAKQHILAHFQSKGKVQVIPCAADLDHFDYQQLKTNEQEALARKLGIKADDFVLSYIGSLGTRYRLDEMMRFFKLLLEHRPKSKFLFISRHDPDFIYQHAQTAGIPKDKLVIQASSYQEIPKYIALSHASIFFIVTSFSGKAVSPTKQAEVLGMGLPIVANTGLGDTDLILADQAVGIVVKDYSEKSLQQAVKQLLDQNYQKERIRTEALKWFALETAVNRYEEVYENL
jgi:glycosyltransferase involved in cell wall biosynthesis